MNNNIEAIIAQVMSEYPNFRNKLDEDILYREAVLAVKGLGNLATEFYETVVEVENGFAKLPDNFYRLDEALLCKEHKVGEHTPVEVRTLVAQDYVVELDFFKTKWIDCDSCCKESSYSLKEKNLFITRTINGNKCYDRFTPVKIAKHTYKYCTPDCIRNQYDCREEVSVDYNRNRLQANFNTGSLYIKYKGFPQDDEGNLDYYDTANGNLERFVEFTLKVKVAEMLMEIAGASHVVNLFQYFIGNRDKYRLKASQEKIYENYDAKRFTKRIKLENARDYNRMSRYRR